MHRIATLVMTVAVLALAVGCGKKAGTTESGGGGGGGSDPPGAPSAPTAPSIEGTYTLVGGEAGGQPLDDWYKAMPEPDKTFKITADKMIATKKGLLPESYKVDPSKTPYEIDFTTKNANGKEEKTYGIYKIEGDTLTICAVKSDKPEDRPKEFKTTAGGKALIKVFQKKAEK
jgi:uncharacterized protein (TIGR03067 family)